MKSGQIYVLGGSRVSTITPDSKHECSYIMIAELKVNLRPVWSPAATALFDLSQRFGDVVWSVLYTELKTLSLEEGALSLSSTSHTEKKKIQGRDSGEGEGSNSDDPWEEERSWRDPSAHKLREIIIQWLDVRLHWKKLLQVRFLKHQLAL